MSLEALDEQWSQSWLQPSPVPVDLAAAITKTMGGAMPVWGRYLASVPWVARGFLHNVGRKVAFMPAALWDLVSFVVSQDNACRYCYGATRTILKVLGYRDQAIDSLERDIDLADLSTAEKAALRLARKISQANPPPTADDLRALVRIGFPEAAVAEIVYAAAFAGYGNRVATLLALPPDDFEQILANPFRRLIRPLIARHFRYKQQPATAPPVPNTPPFADAVTKLGRSPTAHVLRTMLDEAFASSVLPRRTKLLMFAVIGRALCSDWTENEATRALAAEGVSASAVGDVLTNLTSPALDERERLLVPFARETVRYRNLVIQQRTRELASRLELLELIEAVGTAALANSLARLTVLLAPW